MDFTDPDLTHARARAVHQLLDGLPARAELTHSQTRVAYPDRNSRFSRARSLHGVAIFDAAQGKITWDDADGEQRTVTVPPQSTAEAVASMVFALATVHEWTLPETAWAERKVAGDGTPA